MVDIIIAGYPASPGREGRGMEGRGMEGRGMEGRGMEGRDGGKGRGGRGPSKARVPSLPPALSPSSRGPLAP